MVRLGSDKGFDTKLINYVVYGLRVHSKDEDPLVISYLIIQFDTEL